MKNSKKSARRQRRVLLVALLLAALIVGGSTFAWFTSKDEVTNRLSARADYDVALAEDFQAPEDWVPGQQINKDVAVVNTGSVDAFTRIRLSGEMRILQTSDAGTMVDFDNWNTTGGSFRPTVITNLNTQMDNNEDARNFVEMGLTRFYDRSGDGRYYYKMLSKTSTKNPDDSLYHPDDYNALNNTDYYSEVQSMQAPGTLAYAPSGAEYTYVLNQTTDLLIYSNRAPSYTTVRTVPAGTRVYVTSIVPKAGDAMNWRVPDDADMSTVKTVWVSAQTYATNGDADDSHFNPVTVDADSFQPLTPGLYLFARNINLSGTIPGTHDYEFSGYYYSDYDTVATDNNGQITMTHTQHNTPVAKTEGYLNGGVEWVAADGKITAANGDYGKGTYYALKPENVFGTGDNRSDYTVPTDAVALTHLANGLWYAAPTHALEIYTATYKVVEAANLKFRTAEKAVQPSKTIYVVYDKNGDNAFDSNNDIVIEIGLANLGTDAAQWTPISGESSATAITGIPGGVEPRWDASKLTFYYNDDVEAGDTTEKLIDYVKLSDFVSNNAYLAFDFNLNVFMDSVQVTFDESGKEAATPVLTKWESTEGFSAKGTNTNTGDEITKMTWEYVS